MNSLQPKQPSSSPKLPLHRALKNNLQTHFNNSLQIPQFSISNMFSSQKQAFDHALNNLQAHFSNILRMPNPFSSPSSSDSSKNPSILDNLFKKNLALSEAEIKKRMVGIPVYTISNYSENRCSVLSDNEDRDVEFFFFSKSDAEDYMQQFGSRYNLHTLDVPLTDVVAYEGFGAPIRLVPELSQVKNALEERRKGIAALPDAAFSGVPVFQTDQLKFEYSGRPSKYRPVFLRKEDLEVTLTRFQVPESIKTQRVNIQVVALEDIIQTMKDCSTSKWNDVVFIGPGLTLWTWIRRSDH